MGLGVYCLPTHLRKLTIAARLSVTYLVLQQTIAMHNVTRLLLCLSWVLHVIQGVKMCLTSTSALPVLGPLTELQVCLHKGPLLCNLLSYPCTFATVVLVRHDLAARH
jgi:hypothetical protein